MTIQRPEVAAKLAWHDRMRTLESEYGFLPTTVNEANRAFCGVVAFEDKIGGTAHHLSEITSRSRNAESIDQLGAARNVVHEFGHYRTDAVRRREALLSVYSVLKQTLNPNLDIAEIDDLNRLGVLSVIQYVAVNSAINSGRSEPVKGKIIEDTVNTGESHGVIYRLATHYDCETNDGLMVAIKLEQLSESQRRVAAFRDLTLLSGHSQRNRRDFWTSALEQARKFRVINPVVDQAMELSSGA